MIGILGSVLEWESLGNSVSTRSLKTRSFKNGPTEPHYYADNSHAVTQESIQFGIVSVKSSVANNPHVETASDKPG